MENNMKIYLGTDHAGFELKEKLKEYLTGLGHDVIDKGAFKYDETDDYPDFIKSVAEAVQGDVNSRGVIFGASGQGEAMCANRFKGVRAAIFYGVNFELVRHSRAHDDANVLSFAAAYISEDEAQKALTLFLETSFDGGRHQRRIDKMDV